MMLQYCSVYLYLFILGASQRPVRRDYKINSLFQLYFKGIKTLFLLWFFFLNKLCSSLKCPAQRHVGVRLNAELFHLHSFI